VEALFRRRRGIRVGLRDGIDLARYFLRAGGKPRLFLNLARRGGRTGARHRSGGAPFAFWDGANILNHSLRGAVALNVDEAHHHSLFEAALGCADGCFIVVVGTLLAVSPRRPQSIAIDGALLLVAMLMLSPMTSRSHYVALLLPYMTLVAYSWRDRHSAPLGRAVLATSFVLVTLAGNDAVGEAFTVWAYRHSAMVLGTLVLLIYFAVLVIEQLRREQSAGPDAVFPPSAKRWGGIAHSA